MLRTFFADLAHFFRTTNESTRTVIRRPTETVTASIIRTAATVTSSSDRVISAKRDSLHRHIHPQKTNFVNLFWRKSSSQTQFVTHWVKLKVSWVDVSLKFYMFLSRWLVAAFFLIWYSPTRLSFILNYNFVLQSEKVHLCSIKFLFHDFSPLCDKILNHTNNNFPNFIVKCSHLMRWQCHHLHSFIRFYTVVILSWSRY